jgi:hypothetical protein
MLVTLHTFTVMLPNKTLKYLIYCRIQINANTIKTDSNDGQLDVASSEFSRALAPSFEQFLQDNGQSSHRRQTS